MEHECHGAGNHDQYRRGQRHPWPHYSSWPCHYTIFYVQVDDVQGYLDKAGTLGGKTLVPPAEIPTGTFAWFADPDGNTIGLWKPK
jgi:predicted enzyme related to lactoylglutathione lyase